MNLSIEELTTTFCSLPEQDQQEVFDFMYFLKTKSARMETKHYKPLKLGLFKGQIRMSNDFNEPLPDSFWLEGKL